MLLLGGCLTSAAKLDGGVDMAAGTGGGDGGGDMTEVYEFNGATVTLPECGYSITTRDGAGTPLKGTPFLGPSPAPFAIHLGIGGGPEKPADPKTTMAILWRTADDTTLATTVQYGTNGKTDQTYEGYTFRYDTPKEEVRVHEAHLCGLSPDTEYSYRVGGVDSGGTEAWSDVLTFHTAPSLPTTEVVIGVLGDTRDGYTTFGPMLQLMETTATPDIIFFSGDAILLGTDQSEWDTWFAQAEPVLRRVPLVGAEGNHEANAVHYFSQFAFPGNEEDYGLDYGAVHLTVANDSPANPDDIVGAVQQFIDTDMTASESAPWKILMHHRPMWSAAVAHGSDPTLQSKWGPIVDKHKVDFVFNGHDHDYERSKPMRGMNPQATTAQGTTFVVAGSAGAPLYPNGSGFWTALSKSSYNFAILKVKVGSLDMKVYDDQGTVIDMMTVTK